jgi:hypothetical protein
MRRTIGFDLLSTAGHGAAGTTRRGVRWAGPVSRWFPLVCVGVVLVVTVSASRLSAAPADFLDVPGSITVDRAGHVYVSFATDYMVGLLREYDTTGRLLADWQYADSWSPAMLAEAEEGGVYAAIEDGGIVRHYGSMGADLGQWTVTGLKPAIATTPNAESLSSLVWVIAAPGGTGGQARRYGPAGDPQGAWSVGAAASDLVVTGGAAGAPIVVVAEGARAMDGPGWLVRYRADGQRIHEWEVSGAISGIDDGADARVWAAQNAAMRSTGFFTSYDAQGTPGRRCDLPGQAGDLATGPDGTVYVIVHRRDDREREYAVQRYTTECALLDTWEQLQLVGATTPVPRTPTTPTVTPSATDRVLPPPPRTPTEATTATSHPYPTDVVTPTATPVTTVDTPTPRSTEAPAETPSATEKPLPRRDTPTAPAPSWAIHLPIAHRYGEIPCPASFGLEIIPPRIRNSVPGQRCVFLVTLRRYCSRGGPVALSVWSDGGTVSVDPPSIDLGQVAEVTLIPAMEHQEKTLTLRVSGRRGQETETATASLDVLTDMPGVDAERGAYAAEVRGRFIPWLAEKHPELGITADTSWKGTIVTPQILVVMHYLFFSDNWEMHVEWHIMIPPYDWERIDLRHRWDETKPSRAFEISSRSGATEPIEIEPPEKIWR